MNRVYLLITTIIFSINVNGQNWLWAKAMGGAGSDGGYFIIADSLGHLYTTGFFTGVADFDAGVGVYNLTSASPNEMDVFVCKTDTAGNLIWAKSLGGANMDVGHSIAYDPIGNGAVVVSGTFKGQADFDPGAGVFTLASNGLFDDDVFICKLDTAGNFIWAKGIGGNEGDVLGSIAIDPAGTGSIYCMGSFRDTADFNPDTTVFNLISAGQTDIFVSKYDSNGNFIWAKGMGGIAYDWGMDISRCPAGITDVYTTGFFSQLGDFDPGVPVYTLVTGGFDEMFISKLDSAGHFVWAKDMGGRHGLQATCIATDVAGNIYTSGRFRDTADFDPGAGVYNLISNGGEDVFFSKLDNLGNFVWAKGIGGPSYDTNDKIILDAGGDLYAIGGFIDTVDFDPGVGVFNLNNAGNADVYVTKLDNAGNFVWANLAGGTNGEYGHSLAMDVTGQLYVTGYFLSTTFKFDSDSLMNLNPGQTEIFIAKVDNTIITGTDINFSTGNNQIQCSVFPNPFNDLLTIQVNAKAELKIVDLTGRLVYMQNLTSANTQITAPWQPGIYFIEVITETGRYVRKIVKQ